MKLRKKYYFVKKNSICSTSKTKFCKRKLKTLIIKKWKKLHQQKNSDSKQYNEKKRSPKAG